MSNDVGISYQPKFKCQHLVCCSPEVSELIYPATPDLLTSILGKIYVSAEDRVAQVGGPMNR